MRISIANRPWRSSSATFEQIETLFNEILHGLRAEGKVVVVSSAKHVLPEA